MTSEEITAKRRAERKQFKLDRAKAIAAAAAEAEAAFAKGLIVSPALSGPTIPSAATWKPPTASVPTGTGPSVSLDKVEAENEEPPEDIEHLQLTLPEAFFLLWNLDCLAILDPNTVSIISMNVARSKTEFRHPARNYESAPSMVCFPICAPNFSIIRPVTAPI